ncbi:MAG: DUF4230 domain-containing protein [Imperialibacter sp.]|uniref:DUF4230 domain-containing protein n=1 Tax=Imperialibacter sp. TaxID=2038411 RepID=UPI0032EBF9D6
MIFTPKIIFRILLWALLLVGGVVLWFNSGLFVEPATVNQRHQVLLKEIEALGKLELVKYRMQDVVEIERLSKRYLDLGIFRIQDGGDSKAVLIAAGEAVACIDLLKVTTSDIIDGDTLVIQLPKPELCYHKIDHSKSRFYDLKRGIGLEDKEFNQFIDTAYAQAEAQMMKSALDGGILEEAEEMAYKILLPILNKVASRPVIIYFKEEDVIRLN